MPRLDKSEEKIQEFFSEYYAFNPDDPGDSEEIDLCENCCNSVLEDLFGIDHPPYEESDYFCLVCGEKLTKQDYGFGWDIEIS